MCDYFFVEFRCQHHAWIVRKWCPKYERSQRPCTPNIVDPPEFWGHKMCSKCQPPGQLAEAVRRHYSVTRWS
ncbi:hypothetical protein IWW34DRAFT_329558 [Fusarium oxysporum f. sp. albedinis]|uniref:Uncharacterized protein n=6 Tax=Fusarium oxysporum TaxID=5507 RepID=A0A2H3GS37_FUSOX|nr:uncharacterized protein FOBCDRAFT_226351 [Fusarium oxysporum Fo47]KAG7429952.1 hypothetical protein Forpi1262_v009050 [Fusarium oxysporum f. sp. raphani]KAH7227834.1 hypothetical protein BKA60DRAFT_553910 [Fusarium oxysporum]KAI3583587.1 hypothetical protein IWW34DRAFT_329558 [Fusarium oxysporum f. sp. albedinis]KAK2128219.1 hypothetical protein NOF04DRAFT_1325440 [Fusarium oxysporum II5]PCD32966.1 hypothetical protein AU210_009202 [Fusarium oxysporum f. sp. radicis-cucumerinum]RKK16009.1 